MKFLVPGIFVAGALAGAVCAETPQNPVAGEGAVYCFEVGEHDGANFQHMKIALEGEQAPQPYGIIPVHAVVRGHVAGADYTNQYAGTAMEQPVETGGTRLSIALVGNGMGVNAQGAPEIWMFHYSLDLDPQTLDGTLYGIETQSDGMSDGAEIGVVASRAVVTALTPTSCDGDF